MSRPGNTSSRCFEKSVSIDITSSKWPCLGQSFTIKIFPSLSTMVALISPTFSFIKTSCGSLPSRICWRISGTHFGQRESVERGQPRGGFDFSYDLSRGLSDHLGVGDGLGLMPFKRSNTTHAPLAAATATFSTYLIGLRMMTFRLLDLLSFRTWNQSGPYSSNGWLFPSMVRAIPLTASIFGLRFG